jgi:hypothetical protein
MILKYGVLPISLMPRPICRLPMMAAGPAEMQAKGWTLLKEVKRTDDGKAAFKVNFDTGLPPVRYIRIRVKHVTNGDSNYSNMSEITFWNDVLN